MKQLTKDTFDLGKHCKIRPIWLYLDGMAIRLRDYEDVIDIEVYRKDASGRIGRISGGLVVSKSGTDD